MYDTVHRALINRYTHTYSVYYMRAMLLYVLIFGIDVTVMLRSSLVLLPYRTLVVALALMELSQSFDLLYDSRF
jgi:hypothetical protein